MSFIYNMADTWNAVGTTFNGIYMNFTNGAGGAPVGAAASRFFRLDNNGTSVFDIDSTGRIVSNFLGGASAQSLVVNTGLSFLAGVQIANGQGIAFSDGSVFSANLQIDLADTLAQRNGVTAQTHRTYNTFTDASNYERTTLLWTSNYAFFQNQNQGTGLNRPLIYNSGSFTVATLTASLPTAASAGAGARLYVSNPSGIVFGTTVTGSGGGTASPIYSDGTNWRIG